MGATTAQHSTPPCANLTEILPFGPSVNTKSCVTIFGGQHTGSIVSPVALRSCLLTGRWVAWLLDGSCMSREAHVQFCESLGVRFPGATHRNIYVGSKRAGERIMQAVTTFLEQRLKLKVNVSKSAVARPWERMFLGYSMTWHKKPKLKIAQQSRERLAEKIRKTLQGARGGSLEQAIERLNPVLRGWIVYFRLTEVKGVLEDLDGWIRRKLRALLWRHWKRVYTRTKNLMRAGLGEGRAWQSATNGRGPWWNAGASHMNAAYPKSWFDRMGLVSLLETRQRLTPAS
jgi:RNA-directed DNA polymerase